MKPDIDKEKRREYMRRWYAAHPEQATKRAEYTRKWRKANPEKVKQQNARRVAKKREWALANKEVTRRAERNWRMNNKAARNAITAARYARKRGLTPQLTKEEKARVVAFYEKAKRLTELTGRQYHVDHIKALANGGLHHPDNMQVLLGTENQSKGTK